MGWWGSCCAGQACAAPGLVRGKLKWWGFMYRRHSKFASEPRPNQHAPGVAATGCTHAEQCTR